MVSTKLPHLCTIYYVKCNAAIYMRAAKFALTLIYHKPSLCLPGSIVWRQEGTSSNISFSISTFPSSKKVTTRKAMLWLLTSPKNSNRSFSFLSEKKSNFVKALDHLEASQQQSINISIEEGDAACGAQLGCGPVRGQPGHELHLTKCCLSLVLCFMNSRYGCWLPVLQTRAGTWQTHSNTEETCLCCLHFI